MKLTRKIVTAQNMAKIINDEKEYIEVNFGKRPTDHDHPINEAFTANDGSLAEVKDIGYCTFK